jgi:hypothetical protein
MPKPRVIPKFDLFAAIGAFSSIDEEPFRFGKFQGFTPLWVAEHKPDYLIWAYETFPLDKKPCSLELYELCRLDADDEQEDKREALDGRLRFR